MSDVAAKAGYEQRIRGMFGVEAGQNYGRSRTLSWDELPEDQKDRELAIAKAVLAAADEPPKTGAGRKIIEGLQQAAAGNFARVHINGQTWVRKK